VMHCPFVDAWSHAAIDEAMADSQVATGDSSDGPHRAAREATQKSARIAGAVELSARELDAALMDRATQLGHSSAI
jgi:hypothetical protein